MERTHEPFGNLENVPEDETEGDELSHSDSASLSDTDSFLSFDAEWADHIEEDGSLSYIESYVSSTVKEKQIFEALKAAAAEAEKKTFSSPTKNIRHHTKLLNLLRRRPSVRAKNVHLVNDGSNKHTGISSAPKCSSDQSPPRVTFRDNPSGEERKVVLCVIEDGNNLGRRASICETILGILPGRFSEPPDSRVMVAGLAPGSQALRERSIKIGDWLKEINDEAVTWDNLEPLLLNIEVPSTVTIMVQKCTSETLFGDDQQNKKQMTQTQLVKFIVNRKADISLNADSKHPLHAVLYLSLTGLSDSSPELADIKYQFPSWSNKLIQVRGMFITVAHSIPEVVQQEAISSSVMIDGEYYNAAYIREQRDVFLIVLPNSCISSQDIKVFMDQLNQLIRFEFGCLADAFMNPGKKVYIDHLLSLLLEEVFLCETEFQFGRLKIEEDPQISNVSFTPFDSIPHQSNLVLSCFKAGHLFPYPRSLMLKDEVAKLQIENCLNELESGDFGNEESDCEDCQLLYNIIGSCIFYKGFLLSSHLNCQSLQDVWLFCHHHRLLMLIGKEAVSQLVVWRAVYPILDGDTVLENRDILHYLLIVAMNHFMIAILVESGNVTEFLNEKAGPDPFLVDQAETTLYHLHSLHVHAACEESLSSGGIDTITLDSKMSFVSSPKRTKQLPTEESTDGKGFEVLPIRKPDVQSILKQKSSLTFDERVKDSTYGYESDISLDQMQLPCSKDSSIDTKEEEENDDEREENSSESDWKICRRANRTYSNPDEGEYLSGQKGDPYPSLRITVGKKNVLFHFLQFELGEGVLVTPLNSPFSLGLTPQNKLHSRLLQSFYASCSHIRHILQTQQRNEDPPGKSPLNNVKEYGIMFSCVNQSTPGSNKKKSQEIFYWVVGRIYGSPYNRETYVCYDDSLPQNIQEIAFKVTLGCS